MNEKQWEDLLAALNNLNKTLTQYMSSLSQQLQALIDQGKKK